MTAKAEPEIDPFEMPGVWPVRSEAWDCPACRSEDVHYHAVDPDGTAHLQCHSCGREWEFKGRHAPRGGR